MHIPEIKGLSWFFWLVEKVTFSEIDYDIESYDDYLGREVVGACTYIKRYDFAIISEMTYREAYGPLFLFRLLFWGMFFIALIFVGGFAYSSYKIEK